MERATVALVKYDQTPNALRKAVELCEGFEKLKRTDKVLIKPNAGQGLKRTQPPNGVVTTTAVLGDLIGLLRDYGCTDITIGEGPILLPEFRWDPARAFEWSGIKQLAQELGVNLVDFNEGKFTRFVMGGKRVEVSKVALEADFLINVPVLKAHRQSMVSIGLKNLKGCLHNTSKKNFHRFGLGRFIALLNTRIRTDLAIIDGIYALQRGPWGDDAHRLDLLIAGKDVLSCDLVGSTVLGIDPKTVPHFQEFAQMKGRSLDVESIDVRGERIEDVATKLEWRLVLAGETLREDYGVKGVAMDDPGALVCTACGTTAWTGICQYLEENRGATFDNMEFCMGLGPKAKEESRQVFLLGNCAITVNKERKDAIRLKGCPPSIQETYDILKKHAMRE
jgi:uncharacterized protein (DUF362 family)